MDFFTYENTKELFDLLEKCKGIEQNPNHHPEGDVFNHSLQVGYLAFRESYDVDLILAAFFHDIGKMINPEFSKNHPKTGSDLLIPYLSVKSLFLIEHHMRIWYYIKGEMKKLLKCKFLINHIWLPELIQLARWDKMGRNPNKKIKYDRQIIIDRLNKCIDKHFEVPDYLKDFEGCYGLDNSPNDRIYSKN